jgi:hypothetical protein
MEDVFHEVPFTSTPSLAKRSIFDSDLTFDQILQDCKNNKKKFIDVNFPPCDSSIFHNEETKKEDNILNKIQVTWCRPPKDHVFWSGNFQIPDMKQGSRFVTPKLFFRSTR